jgi:plastocyanin
MELKRLQHAKYLCRDLEASRKFYTDVLGMEEIPRKLIDPVRKGAWFKLGDTRFHLAQFCLLHPGQAGAVVVMPRGSKLPYSQAQYNTMAAAQVSRTIAQGEAAMASAKVEVEKTRNARVYTLSLIASPAGPAAIDRFTPESLTVKAGDTVRWVMKDPTEAHTVTFPGNAPPPDFLQEGPRAQGPSKVYCNPKAAAPAGGPIHAAGPYYNSGLTTVWAPGDGAELCTNVHETRHLHLLVHRACGAGHEGNDRRAVDHTEPKVAAGGGRCRGAGAPRSG